LKTDLPSAALSSQPVFRDGDDSVRTLAGQDGSSSEPVAQSPPTVWYKEVRTPEQFVDDVSQVFLGQRLACAQCHHHPYEKWSQDDYWGLAAFYGRVGFKAVATPGVSNQNQQNQKQLLFVRSTGNVQNKRTGQTAPMKALDSDPMTATSDEDPRAKFADWMTSPKNPFFAKAIANRLWAHYLGRGLVEPIGLGYHQALHATGPMLEEAELEQLRHGDRQRKGRQRQVDA
jgi:hypothetical protein